MLADIAATARHHRIPYIIAPHGMLEPWSLNARRLRKVLALHLYQGRVLMHAAAIHATSEQEAENIRQLSCVRSRVHVIPNVVDSPPSAQPAGNRKGGERRTLLFLSRIHPKKGLDILLEAWKLLRPQGWRLAIVGSGEPDYVASLHRRCVIEGIADVDFCPHVHGAQREEAYASATAFVLPTYSENFGNVVAEALMRGLPVITTTGTPWSSLIERQCGWYVAPTVAGLQSALSELFAGPSAMLQSMGERGRAYAAANFSVEAVRASLIEMYRSAIDSRAGSRQFLSGAGLAA
jgi:glycosyltransferase involved in cell wall biosynthesis